MNKFFSVLAAAWILLIGALYYRYHPLYLAALSERSFLTVGLVIVFAVFILMARYAWYRNVRTVRWEKVTLLKVLLVIFGVTYIIANLFYFERGLFPEVSWFSFQWGLLTKLFGLALGLVSVVLPCIAVGSKIRAHIALADSESMLGALVSIGYGMMLLALALFAIAASGTLNVFTVSGTLLLMLVIALPEAIDTVRRVVQRPFAVEWKVWSLASLLTAAALLTIAFNIMHIIRPIPYGWDEFVRYLNTPKILADTGALFSGTYAYPFGLIMSTGFVLFKSLAVALGLSQLMGILTALTIYAVSREFVKKELGWIVACLFLLIPFVIFQSSREVKVDLAATFFTTMSLAILVIWWKNNFTREHTIGKGIRSLWSAVFSRTHPDRLPQRSLIATAGLFAGMAFTIKYTSILFIIACAFAVIVTGFGAKRYVSAVLCTILFLLWSSVPYLPWGTYFVGTAPVVSYETFTRGTRIGPKVACTSGTTDVREDPQSLVRAENADAIDSDATSLNARYDLDAAGQRTGTEEELGRYLGYEPGIWRYVLAPWTITMNPIVRGSNVDIGFLFLGLIPPLLLFVPWQKKHPLLSSEYTAHRSLWVFFGVCTVTYWALWLFLARGVIWYGLPGISLLLIIIAGQIENRTVSSALRTISLGAVGVFAVLVVGFRIVNTVSHLQLRHMANAITATHYVDTIIPKYRDAYEIINAHPSTKEDPAYVYRIGTFIPYFIYENHKRVYTDDQMDMLTCIRETHTDEETIQKLKDLGFRYVVFDLNIPSIDQTPDKTLIKKWQDTARFIKENLTTLVIKQDKGSKMILAELP